MDAVYGSLRWLSLIAAVGCSAGTGVSTDFRDADSDGALSEDAATSDRLGGNALGDDCDPHVPYACSPLLCTIESGPDAAVPPMFHRCSFECNPTTIAACKKAGGHCVDAGIDPHAWPDRQYSLCVK